MICWRGTANRRATPVTTTQYVLRATPCPFDRQRHHSRCVSGTLGDFIPAISLASNCLIAAKPLAGGAPGHDDSLEADVQRICGNVFRPAVASVASSEFASGLVMES